MKPSAIKAENCAINRVKLFSSKVLKLKPHLSFIVALMAVR